MFVYTVRRLLATIPILLVVALATFGLIHLAPGDPAAIIAGDQASSQQIDAIRQKLGFDRSLAEQFFIWAGNLLRGDLGVSVFSNRPVLELIGQRLEPTLALTVSTILLTVLISAPLGILAAWHENKFLDHAIVMFTICGFAIPVFVLGYFFILVFAINVNWFPAQGYRPLSMGWVPFLEGLVLPSVTLALSYSALITRVTRAAAIEVLHADFIRTAFAKGLRLPAILFRHVLRNAAIPMVTAIGIGLTLLIGGVVVTESVFAIPGVGRLVVNAILNRDYPVIQAATLLFSVAYLAINLSVDLTYGWIDPRVRLK